MWAPAIAGGVGSYLIGARIADRPDSLQQRWYAIRLKHGLINRENSIHGWATKIHTYPNLKIRRVSFLSRDSTRFVVSPGQPGAPSMDLIPICFKVA